MTEQPKDIAEGTRRVAELSVDDFDQWPIEKRIAWILLHDLHDRRGFKYWWETIPESIQQELEASWEEMIKAEIEKSDD